jgi:uncharacterized protein with GYD domain
MPKYLMQASLTKDGVKGLAQEGGSKRRQAIEQLFKPVGGKLEALYFAFGDTDAFAIVDFPDNVSAAAVSVAANAAGAAHVKATVLITPEEMDQAAEKSRGLRPPGGGA